MKTTKTLTALALSLFVVTAPAALAKNDKPKKSNKIQSQEAQQFSQHWAQFDRNADGVITLSEFPADRATFDRFDTNRDGVLTKNEARTRLQDRDAAEYELRQLDANRDGVISRSEWRGDTAAFNRMDRNGDGVLSSNDRGRTTTNTNSKRFHGLDRNRDGMISRNEWRGNDTSFRQQDRNRDGVISQQEMR
jgi:Ca2+-binding EF-hand superfamily protein